MLAATTIVVIARNLSALRSLDPNTETFFIGAAVTYCASVIVLTFYTPKGGKIRLIELTVILASVFGSFFLFLLLSQSVYSRWILIIGLAMVSAFAFVSLTLKTTLQKPALALVSALIVLLLAGGSKVKTRASELTVENKLVRTHFYNLIATYHRNFVMQEATGGAISKFGDQYLLATGDGKLHFFSWDAENKKLESRKLPYQVPLNRDEFVRDGAKNTRYVNTSFFRTADILVQDFGEDFRLFASHHHWNREKQCFTVRISAISEKYSNFLASEGLAKWQTLYESKPCLTFKNKGDAFGGYQIGGKLVLLDNNTLLFTVGDHTFDGVESDEILAQDQTGHYGKTILLELDTLAAAIYSTGHRNPQGLHVDARGTIWLTEHGPRGGDELNLILKGKNYGWPLVTYGTDYSQPIWPLSTTQGRHEGFELPVYAWIPSIGLSAIISIQGELFKIWKDDLLVASLADKSVWRLRVDGGRAIFAERITISERIRAILEDSKGRLILWTEESFEGPTQTGIIVVEPVLEETGKSVEGLTKVERGELLFARCSACHRVDDGNNHTIGPDLRGMLQRPIAGANRYNYSEALKGRSGRWTEKKLDAFLENPQRFAPGTSMQFAGVPDPAERASLIEYLKNQK